MLRYLTNSLIILTLLLSSCTKMPEKYPCDNTKDPDCEGYVMPNAVFTSTPSQGEVIDTNTITFTWDGNQTYSVFSYRISETSSWSEWSNNKSVTYECMTDGIYNFYVKEAYPTGDEQVNPTSVSFSIDYIYGSAIILEDQCIETTVNSEFEVFVSLEEVSDVLGAFISISFDHDIVRLTERQVLTSILGSASTDLVFIATELQEANTNGLLEINLARFSGVSSASGSKQIVGLKFRAISNEATQVIINRNSELRDADNNVIVIDKLVNATINIL